MTTVEHVVTALGEQVTSDSGPVVLLGFDAGRHVFRHKFGPVEPMVVDMPICEETMVGAALGLAAAHRTVVVDLMFEGFLTRCLEPLSVGLTTAAAFAPDGMAPIVLRVLGAPIAFGGPSHSVSVLPLLQNLDGIEVVYVAGADDVDWALTSPTTDVPVVVLVDSPDPAAMSANFDPLTIGGMPARLLRTDSDEDELLICMHNDVSTNGNFIQAEGRVDVLSVPYHVLPHDDAFEQLVSRYARVSTRDVIRRCA